jgi:hypothetical protein
MSRDEVISALQAHRAELDEYFVDSISLFGSVARGDAGPDSDVDLLVEFTKPVGLFHISALKLHLEDLLGCGVDLVPRQGIKPRIRESVLAEEIRVA